MGKMTYKGLTIAIDEAGDVRAREVTGLDDVSADVGIARLPNDHGGVPVPGYAGGREVTALVRLVTDLPTQRALIRAALVPTVDEETLLVEWPDEPPMQLQARLASRVLARTPGGEVAGPEMRVVWVASDPVMYGTTLQTESLDPYTGTEFADYPADYPSFGSYPKVYGSGGTGGGVLVDNDGSWPVWPRFEISGPSSGTVEPQALENVTTGEKVEFSGLLVGQGKTLVVDMHPARRQVAFSDGANRMSTVVALDSWWQLQPGTNELRYRAGGSTPGSTAEVQYRDGYM